jgi:hypothetical protein
VRNQLGKLTNTPTLRWVFQCFQVVHFLRINQSPKVVNLTEERSLILEFLPSSCQKYYLGNNNQDLRSTAIYGAKIIIFKILPLYIVPLRKS